MPRMLCVCFMQALRKSAAQPVRSGGAFGGSKGAADAIRKQEYMRAVNAGLVK